MNDPSANLNPRPCEVVHTSLLTYLPINGKSIPWETIDLQQPWHPGNYCIEMTSISGYYCAGGAPWPMEMYERLWGKVVKPLITGQQPTCVIKDMKQVSSESLETTWIVTPHCDFCILSPELYENRQKVNAPENLVLLPSSLINDYKRHNFTVDLARGNSKIITFPGISAESENLLNSCSVQVDERNMVFLRAHFRLSLWVHCSYGDIACDYQDDVIEDRLDMIEDGLRSEVVDPLDVAVHDWLARRRKARAAWAEDEYTGTMSDEKPKL